MFAKRRGSPRPLESVFQSYFSAAMFKMITNQIWKFKVPPFSSLVYNTTVVLMTVVVRGSWQHWSTGIINMSVNSLSHTDLCFVVTLMFPPQLPPPPPPPRLGFGVYTRVDSLQVIRQRRRAVNVLDTDMLNPPRGVHSHLQSHEKNRDRIVAILFYEQMFGCFLIIEW